MLGWWWTPEHTWDHSHDMETRYQQSTICAAETWNNDARNISIVTFADQMDVLHVACQKVNIEGTLEILVSFTIYKHDRSP